MSMPASFPDFSKNSNEVAFARLARLLVVQFLYSKGAMTTKDAKTMLAGPLTPGDETTIFDDANCLEVRQ